MQLRVDWPWTELFTEPDDLRCNASLKGILIFVDSKIFEQFLDTHPDDVLDNDNDNNSIKDYVDNEHFYSLGFKLQESKNFWCLV